MAGGGIRGALGITSQVLIGGALVLMFFVVLSGVRDATPLNLSWFLRADTSSLPGSGRAESYWTFWRVCATGGGQCGATVPALPFGYAWVGGTDGVPGGLIGSRAKNTTSNYYYYMWRFGWVFYLMSLVFTAITFITSILAPCSRLASGVSGALLSFSLFWFSLAAALMTVTFVKARDEFRSAGISANIGRYAFGFTWGAWAAMFIATVLLFMGCGVSRKGDDSVRTKRTGSSVPFFRRQRSTRSARRSFVADTESQHRVKDEY